jgi:hypothetical protein
VSAPSPRTAGVTIRPAFPDDAPAVARLAALDSQRAPTGPLLLAEIDGEPWAAIALGTGRLYADPFRPTAALADLLRRRQAQLAQDRLEEIRKASRQSRPQLAAVPEGRRALRTTAAPPAPRRAPAR